MLIPVELTLGGFEDVATAPLLNGAARAAAAWEDAAAALTRDPALALAPLHLLRRHRFHVSYPASAPGIVMDALRRAQEAAATSPSLADGLWTTAAVLLGSWQGLPFPLRLRLTYITLYPNTLAASSSAALHSFPFLLNMTVCA
jgi:hypothetical protein